MMTTRCVSGLWHSGSAFASHYGTSSLAKLRKDLGSIPSSSNAIIFLVTSSSSRNQSYPTPSHTFQAKYTVACARSPLRSQNQRHLALDADPDRMAPDRENDCHDSHAGSANNARGGALNLNSWMDLQYGCVFWNDAGLAMASARAFDTEA